MSFVRSNLITAVFAAAFFFQASNHASASTTPEDDQKIFSSAVVKSLSQKNSKGLYEFTVVNFRANAVMRQIQTKATHSIDELNFREFASEQKRMKRAGFKPATYKGNQPRAARVLIARGSVNPQNQNQFFFAAHYDQLFTKDGQIPKPKTVSPAAFIEMQLVADCNAERTECKLSVASTRFAGRKYVQF